MCLGRFKLDSSVFRETVCVCVCVLSQTQSVSSLTILCSVLGRVLANPHWADLCLHKIACNSESAACWWLDALWSSNKRAVHSPHPFLPRSLVSFPELHSTVVVLKSTGQNTHSEKPPGVAIARAEFAPSRATVNTKLVTIVESQNCGTQWKWWRVVIAPLYADLTGTSFYNSETIL